MHHKIERLSKILNREYSKWFTVPGDTPPDDAVEPLTEEEEEIAHEMSEYCESIYNRIVDKDSFLRIMQSHVIKIAIGGSTLRNQGAKGVKEAAIKYLSRLDLSLLKSMAPLDYPKWLDDRTEDLIKTLPDGGNHWGTARKAINVFMVQAYLNKYLSLAYGLEKFKDTLETPLDSYAVNNLKKHAKDTGWGKLPRWEGIKSLKPESSSKYQNYALFYAQDINMPRACMDILLWNND